MRFRDASCVQEEKVPNFCLLNTTYSQKSRTVLNARKTSTTVLSMTLLTVITRSVKASKLSDERWEERGKLGFTEDIEEEEKIRRKRKDTAKKDKEGKKGKMSVGTEG